MIGFEKIQQQLETAVISDMISHAHLIIGPDGIGKSVFADAFAKSIIRHGSHKVDDSFVDIIEIKNDKLSIGVEDVRNILREASTKPFEGDRKVIIIYQADKMTIQAQNALLKSLEEPSMGVFFILVAENKENLLPTIQSRVQVHRLNPLSKSDLDKYINQNFDVSLETAEFAKALSFGLPGNIDRFLKDDTYRNFLDDVFNLMDILSYIKSLRDQSSYKLLSKSKEMLEFDLQEYFNTVIFIARDLLLIKMGSDYKKLIFLYNKEVLENLSRKYSSRRLNHIISVMEKGLFLLGPGKNINKETIADYILFKLLEEV